MGYPDTFVGYCVDSPKSWNQFSKSELKPKPFESHDIDVEIDACGVCGSDVHTVTGGWGDFKGPLCVGHEVVGRAVRVGEHVRGITKGDRVGVGAQVQSCLECKLCKSKNENYCPKMVDTYNAQYPDGSWAHGGFASHIRAHEYFTFRIPEALETNVAAPLLCAGITTYSPLFRGGVGPGKKVGILGIGGLGHLGIQFAKGLGADVYALTTSADKAEDCKKLGATDVILTKKDKWADDWKYFFDFILCCSDMTHTYDLAELLTLVRPMGDFHMVGIPDEALPQLSMGSFAGNAPKLTGSHLGNHQEMEDMLRLAAEKGIKPWVETLPLGAQGCKEAVERVKNNKVHYRFTLTGFDKEFKDVRTA